MLVVEVDNLVVQKPILLCWRRWWCRWCWRAGGDGHTQMEEQVDLVLTPSNFQIPAPAMAPAPYGDPGPVVVHIGWRVVVLLRCIIIRPIPPKLQLAAARGGGASHGPGAAGFAGAGNGVVSSTSGVH